MDGSVLKSFAYDSARDISYLITADLSSDDTVVPSVPVKVQKPISQLGTSVPIAAHMMFNGGDEVVEKTLSLVTTGNFDTVWEIDETTGEIVNTVVGNLAEDVASGPSEFYCDLATKDCDYWATSCYDSKGRALYFQAHQVIGDDGIPEAMIHKTNWFTNRVTGQSYPLTNAVVDMTFGYASYQFVEFE
jgi:hypothetical protein